MFLFLAGVGLVVLAHSLLLNVMDRKFLFEETCIVSVKRRTFLSANTSAKSLWFRNQSLSRRVVCCSPFILVVTVCVVLRFFHGCQILSCHCVSSHLFRPKPVRQAL